MGSSVERSRQHHRMRVIVIIAVLCGMITSRFVDVSLAHVEPGDVVPVDRSFESDGYETGKPQNHDFVASSQFVGTPPANYDFAAGSAGWEQNTTSNVNFVSGVGPYASYVQLGKDNSSSWGTVTSSAFTVDASSQVMSLHRAFVGSGGYNYLFVYVMSGPTYSTSTTIVSQSFNGTTGWERLDVAVAQWRGQSIKLKITGHRLVNVTNVGSTSIPLADWTVDSGVVERLEHTDFNGQVGPMLPNPYASLKSSHGSGNTQITSPEYSIGDNAQSLTFMWKPFAYASNGNLFRIFIVRPDGSQTEVLSRSCPASMATDPSCTIEWHRESIDITDWAGETIRVRVNRWVGSDGPIGIDDIGVVHVDLNYWQVVQGLTRREAGGPDGSHFANLYGGETTIVSSGFMLPSNATKVSLQYKFFNAHANKTNWIRVYVMSGDGFTTETKVGEVMSQNASDWQTLSPSVAEFAGQSIRIKINRWSGSPGPIGVDDVMGILSRSLSVADYDVVGGVKPYEDGMMLYSVNLTYTGTEQWFENGAGLNSFTKHTHLVRAEPGDTNPWGYGWDLTAPYTRMRFYQSGSTSQYGEYDYSGVKMFEIPDPVTGDQSVWRLDGMYLDPTFGVSYMGGWTTEQTYGSAQYDAYQLYEWNASIPGIAVANYGFLMCEDTSCYGSHNLEYAFQVWP